MLGPTAGQHDLALAEGEVDAPPLVAGDDGRLANRRKRSHRQLDPHGVVTAGKCCAI